MSNIQLTEIERVKEISKQDFYTNYVKKQKPVVVEQLIAQRSKILAY